MRILAAVEPVDFRRGIDGLARLCREVLSSEPFLGTVFLFCNRRATAVKLLVYDGHGFSLCQKRLSRGHFRFWPAPGGEVRVRVEHSGGGGCVCPKCGKGVTRYDVRRREWRHLDTCQLRTILEAEVPRVECAEDGVLQMPVPWAEPGSRLTALFECVVIDWLKEASLHAVAVRMALSWDEHVGSLHRLHPGSRSGRRCEDRLRKLHVAQMLGDAVDDIRRAEHRDLLAEGMATLQGTRYLWLRHPANLTREEWTGRFARLRRCTRKTARAWALREEAMGIQRYVTRGWADKAWRSWFAWALRSRLEPVKRIARTVKSHLGGVLNAIVQQATNSVGESVNAGIQRVKRMACGFRNRERFRRAIYFHLGELDLYPTLAGVTHTRV